MVAVITYHFFPRSVPGGFLGVTTFFVLAGALATWRIGSEITTTGRFDARAHAAGRVRPVLPALLVFVA